MLAMAGDLAGLAVARLAMRGIVALSGGRFRGSPDCRSIRAFSVLDRDLVGLRRVVRTRAGAARRRSDPNDSCAARDAIVDRRPVARPAAVVARRVAGRARVRSRDRGRTASGERSPIARARPGRTRGQRSFELHLPDARYDSRSRAQSSLRRCRVATEAIPGIVAAGRVQAPATGPYNSGAWRCSARTARHGARSNVSAQQRVISGVTSRPSAFAC